MSRKLAIAAVQMDAEAGPVGARLERARHWVRQAAQAGAEIVVLPELFNTGYSYDPARVEIETWDGPTRRSLLDLAKTERVTVAGTLLVRDGGDVYNTLVLAVVDGTEHRYDKVYPWGWERSLFRASRRRSVVADTPLGRIGLMVCWDTAHPRLWAEYADRVDLVLAASCPPDVSNPSFELEGGRLVTQNDSPLLRGLSGGASELFGQMIDEQTAWLGVPLVNSVGCGRVTTPVPRSQALAGVFAPFDWGLARRWRDFARARLSCDLTPGCKVVDASGVRVSERTQADGEGFALGQVTLNATPRPRPRQPRSRLPRSAYLLSDFVLPRLMEPVYRRHLERTIS